MCIWAYSLCGKIPASNDLFLWQNIRESWQINACMHQSLDCEMSCYNSDIQKYPLSTLLPYAKLEEVTRIIYIVT